MSFIFTNVLYVLLTVLYKALGVERLPQGECGEGEVTAGEKRGGVAAEHEPLRHPLILLLQNNGIFSTQEPFGGTYPDVGEQRKNIRKYLRHVCLTGGERGNR